MLIKKVEGNNYSVEGEGWNQLNFYLKKISSIRIVSLIWEDGAVGKSVVIQTFYFILDPQHPHKTLGIAVHTAVIWGLWAAHLALSSLRDPVSKK